MDRLHAYCYFLEGLLPCAEEEPCASVIAAGIERVAAYLHQIRPSFERSDVFAQLLRMRLFAEWSGRYPIDRQAAAFEAEQLAGFQCMHSDPRIDGGFYFGRKCGKFLPHINPVSTAFGLQALALWNHYLAGGLPLAWHALI